MEICKVKVGGKTYEIKEMRGAFESDGKLADGDINYRDCVIRVNTDSAGDYQSEVLIHEIIHAVIEEYNVPVGNENEKLTEALAKGMYQVLKDNFES